MRRDERASTVQILKALRLASPICFASRFEDGLAHCIEASRCSAEALSRRQIEARAVPCAVAVVQGQKIWSLGLNPLQLYERLEDPKPSFEIFTRGFQTHAEEILLHMVVEVHHGKERIIVDSTIGQLRKFGAPVHHYIEFIVPNEGGWVELSKDDVTIRYLDSPIYDCLPEMAKNYENQEYVNDLSEAMDLAIHCNFDTDKFLAELRRRNPEMDSWLVRLEHWLRLGTTF